MVHGSLGHVEYIVKRRKNSYLRSYEAPRRKHNFSGRAGPSAKEMRAHLISLLLSVAAARTSSGRMLGREESYAQQPRCGEAAGGADESTCWHDGAPEIYTTASAVSLCVCALRLKAQAP